MEELCGSLVRYPLTVLAMAAAAKIVSAAESVLSVTVDPEGRVFVESTETAAEQDIIATYLRPTPAERRILEQQIVEELRAERAARKLAGELC